MIGNNIEEQSTILESGTAIIIPEGAIREKLALAENQKRSLVIKLGFDPTAPDLHLGHVVVLKKLRQFQDLGHRVVVILGDFTACIGDPTGKNKSRPPLSPTQVQQNATTYLDQLSKVLDMSKLEVRTNNEWFDVMSLRETIALLAQHTLARILERDDFSKRYKEGVPITMHELVYPLLQGYDSFMIDADIEIGGTDQLFNCLMGRYIQETKDRVGQAVLCMPLLKGVDGRDKMSKSQGNYIALADTPNQMYGKVMSIPDTLLLEYIDLATNFNASKKEEIRELLRSGENPMNIKKIVAMNVVWQYYGELEANNADNFFRTQIQEKGANSKKYTQISLEDLGLSSQNLALVDLCVTLDKGKSRRAIKEMIQSGAVSINGEKITDINHIFLDLKNNTQLKIGKRGYFEILTLLDI